MLTKTILTLLMAVTPQTRATINRALRPSDFDIVWTANAAEAVEASARCRPDLLLLDLNEPERRGIVERLRVANPSTPVVVLVEHKSDYDEALSTQAGAVLQKPVGAIVLAHTVNTLLKLPVVGVASDGVTTDSERFRAMLLERYTAPYALPPSYRDWGINE